MPDNPQRTPDLTRPPSGEAGAMSVAKLVWAAGAFTVVWLVCVALYVRAGLGASGLIGLAMTAMVLVLPLALAWYAVATLTVIRTLRAESAGLQAALETMRASYASSQQQAQVAVQMRPAERTAERPVSFATRRDGTLTVPSADRKSAMQAPRPAMLGEEQPGLALGTPTDEPAAPLAMADFVRAIHFPENPDDAAGFHALRLALTDRTAAKLIRASQDVLTLLAQDGIYMDDLHPDRARPELWRKFAAGERGRAIAGLGGIRDRSCLALTVARMREDAVFRDAAHHFLRSFDKAIVAAEPGASDAELSALSDTRTARAFMLFGRVTGTFD